MFGTIAHKPQAIPFDKLKKAIFSDNVGKFKQKSYNLLSAIAE